MQPRSFEQRLTMLEQQMHEMRGLLERVRMFESQILQLRQEMRDEFSALRDDVRGEMTSAVKTLGEAIAATNTQMRVLHEDVITRIETMGEGRRSRRKSR